jgi:hypothetical protein
MVVFATAAACSSSQTIGRRQTDSPVCHTDADCANGRRCELQRCVGVDASGTPGAGGTRSEDAGVANGASIDASIHATGGGGARDASVGDRDAPDATRAPCPTIGDAGAGSVCVAACAIPRRAAALHEFATGDTLSAAVAQQQLGVAADGSVLAVWASYGGGLSFVYASRHVPGAGWSASLLPTGSFADGAQVAVSANGEAMALWQESVYPPDGGQPNIRSHTSRYAGGWRPSQLIGVPARSASEVNPRIEADARGNFFAGWNDFVDARTIRFARYARESGWEQPIAPTSHQVDGGTPSAAGPYIRVEPGGNAVVAWSEVSYGPQGSTVPIFVDAWLNVQRYVPGVGWSSTEEVAAESSASGRSAQDHVPGLAIDGAGNVVVAWTDAISNSRVEARVFSGGTWSSVVQLDATATTEGLESPQLGTDANGHFIATWSKSDAGVTEVYASELTLGGAWSPPTRLNPAVATPAPGATSPFNYNTPAIAMSRSGDAIVTFSGIGRSSMSELAVAYAPELGWEAPIELGPTNTVVPPLIDDCGNGTVIWEAGASGGITVSAARYVRGFGWRPSVSVAATSNVLCGPLAAAVGSSGQVAAIWETCDAVANRQVLESALLE